MLVTDGLIGFEREIVRTILEQLPSGSRVHTVGVGSAVNRTLTGSATRAGRGVEVVIGLGEDPERAAARLRARMESPLVVDVTFSGSALLELAPKKISDLYRGAPVLIAARVRPEGGEIVVQGRGAAGPWEERVLLGPAADGGDGVKSSSAPGRGMLAALFAREG